MKYMLMIYDRDDWFDTATPEMVASSLEEHGAFAAFLQGRGADFSGEALHPAKAATTLRSSDGGGGLIITDGPFVELKEHLGGFYIIEASDLDDAIEVAKNCPSAYAIEVRPVMVFDG